MTFNYNTLPHKNMFSRLLKGDVLHLSKALMNMNVFVRRYTR